MYDSSIAGFYFNKLPRHVFSQAHEVICDPLILQQLLKFAVCIVAASEWIWLAVMTAAARVTFNAAIKHLLNGGLWACLSPLSA